MKGIYTPEIATTYGYPKSEILANTLVNTFDSHNWVIDFGCGDCFYLEQLQKSGFEKLLGIDGYLPNKNFRQVMQWDLSTPVDTVKGEVLSLEVGEHIPQEYEQTFINNLCAHCETRMVISWAVPGQHGTGHINCRENSYIINEVEKRGLFFSELVTKYLRSEIEQHVDYFKHTLMAFYKP